MTPLAERLAAIVRELAARFLGKEETLRLAVLCLLAGEHALLVGPPGTAKSALLRELARAVDARYFEYLLTRFTEPNELFGPVDVQAYRSGTYRRRTEGMLPEAEIVLLDEVFKSNSAVLNSLLGVLNERRLLAGGERLEVPVLSVFGATNELAADDALAALFDRFLLRIRQEPLEAHHFEALVRLGLQHERELRRPRAPTVAAQELRDEGARLLQRFRPGPELLAQYKGLVLQIRAEGIPLSDRRAVKLLKLVAGSAWLDGRAAPDVGDLSLLRHVWSHEDQVPVLDGIVGPVLDGFHREHPERARSGGLTLSVEDLAREVERIRQVLTEGTPPSDTLLFAELRALGEIRAALQRAGDEKAQALERRVAQLLSATLTSGRFATL